MKCGATLIVLCFIIFNLNGFAKIKPIGLTCEYLKDPGVIDVLNPRLAWINKASEGEQGQCQTAWQIKVASSEEKLAKPDLWDSKKVISDNSIRVKYNGKSLVSRQECWWQVRVWDRRGKVSGWSEPAFWRMGLLHSSDWKAEWIGAPWQGEEALPKPKGGPDARPEKFGPPAPLFRKEFSIEKEVVRAVAFVTGLGYFELYLNGKKVGDDLLVPNQTNYGKRPDLINENIPVEDNFREYRVMYLAYDIKPFLQKGKNAAGTIVGNGFYNPAKYWAGAYGSPRFLAQFHINYADGTEDIIVSDRSWKASESAILMDMVYYGEYYDARKEQPGWCTAGFRDFEWKEVFIRKAPEGKLVAHTANPDRVMDRFTPVKIEKTGEGKYFVDFGVEISGWLRLNNVSGPPGHKIEISFKSNQYSGDNTYIFRGEGTESYAPRFNWFVFSTVEITNWPGELRPEMVTAEAVNTFIEEKGRFETSDQLFNDINKIWKRSQLDNMHGGIASDCPHRERAPYTGDGQVACVTVMHNFDAKNFYYKWIQDIRGAQNPETGYVPNGAPWEPGCGGGVAWGAAMVIIPWEFYLHYGALDILEDNYEAMKGYVGYMQKWVEREGIMFSQIPGKNGKPLKWFNLGDWSGPGQIPPDNMVHTFYFWRCADLTSRAAKVLGKAGEAEFYENIAEKTRQAFQKKFYDPVNETYGKGGGNIFALKMGVPESQYQKVIATLKSDIKAAGGHLDTGIFGTQFFFEVLSDNGLNDLAYEAISKRDIPGYGNWLELGSTTTRESWDSSNSHNHPMFGGGLTWFYRKLAGMETDPQNPGYKHIIFRPRPVKDLGFVTYSNETPYGMAGIDWKTDNSFFSLEVKVPVGSTATVHVPVFSLGKIKERDIQLSDAKRTKFISFDHEYTVYQVGSGTYRFKVKFNP